MTIGIISIGLAVLAGCTVYKIAHPIEKKYSPLTANVNVMENVTNVINETTEAKVAKWTFIRETIASVWRTFKSSYVLKIMIGLALGGAGLALGGAGLIEAKEAHAELKREKEREYELTELDHKIAVNAKLRELEASKNA